MTPRQYPDAVDASLVGTYPAQAGAGGGYVWDDVLEYRVWCHPERNAPDSEDGSDYYFAYAKYVEALCASETLLGAEEPLALIRQAEYIKELEPGEYRHVRAERVTEWPVIFLKRPRRTQETIPAFMSPNAPANRLAILRGYAEPSSKVELV